MIGGPYISKIGESIKSTVQGGLYDLLTPIGYAASPQDGKASKPILAAMAALLSFTVGVGALGCTKKSEDPIPQPTTITEYPAPYTNELVGGLVNGSTPPTGGLVATVESSTPSENIEQKTTPSALALPPSAPDFYPEFKRNEKGEILFDETDFYEGYEGLRLAFPVTVYNDGGTKGNAVIELHYLLRGEYRRAGKEEISLEPNSSVDVIITGRSYLPQDKSYDVMLKITYKGEDSNPDNDTAEGRIYLPGLADLVVENVEVSPTQRNQDDSITYESLKLSGINNGGKPIDDLVVKLLSETGELLGESEAYNVDSNGGTVNAIIEGLTLKPGEQITAVFDYKKFPSDSEVHSQILDFVAPHPPADFVFSGVYDTDKYAISTSLDDIIIPDKIIVDNIYYLHLKLTNDGKSPSPETPLDVRIDLEGIITILDEGIIPDLGPGESGSVVVPIQFSEIGSYEIKIMADPYDTVSEIDNFESSYNYGEDDNALIISGINVQKAAAGGGGGVEGDDGGDDGGGGGVEGDDGGGDGGDDGGDDTPPDDEVPGPLPKPEPTPDPPDDEYPPPEP